jgi:hypothetical protein
MLPRRRGMCGDIDVLDPVSGVRDREEHVQGPEREGRHGAEVRCPDAGSMVSEEGASTVGRRTPQGVEARATDGLCAHVVAPGCAVRLEYARRPNADCLEQVGKSGHTLRSGSGAA